MRPIDRGTAPRTYTNYQDAKPDLLIRIGMYCCYCERRFPAGLAVEHIQAKTLAEFVHLEREWSNFLLACPNCNAMKGSQPVDLHGVLLPDRDNTFVAFEYDEFGVVQPAQALPPAMQVLAEKTIAMVGLNRAKHENDHRLAMMERFQQRAEVYAIAKDVRADFEAGQIGTKQIAREAAAHGFFSIWMHAFAGVPTVRQAIIGAFVGTAVECFGEETLPVSPRPDNGLVGAGKI